MSGDKIILFACMIAISSALQCPQYQCVSQPNSNICAVYEVFANTYNVSSCAANQYCSSPSPPYNSMCVNMTTSALNLPGQKCKLNTDCLSSNCTKGYCSGSTTGQPCTSTSVYNSNSLCGAGYYCNQNAVPAVCGPLKSQGVTCSNDYECTYGYGCFDSTVCTKFFSVPLGQTIPVELCYSYTSYYCELGSCIPNADGINATCSNPYVNFQSFPLVCPKAGFCVSDVESVTKTSISQNCICTYGGVSYCPSFNGDGYSGKYDALLRTWYLQTGVSKCNINIAYSPACALAQWSSSNANKLAYYYYMGNQQTEILLTNSASCVQSAFYPGYASVKSAYDYSEVLFVAGLFGLVMA